MKRLISLMGILTLCAIAGRSEEWNPTASFQGVAMQARTLRPRPQTDPGPAGTCKNQKTIDGVAVCFPDPGITPGDPLPDVTQAQVCVPGYSGGVRDVSDDTKREIIESYGIAYDPGHEGKIYEVDHLISLELGGSNDPKNLWPEPYQPKPGAREKDRVEDYLHAEVCKGTLSLKRAQEIISTDWYSCYLQYRARQACQ